MKGSFYENCKAFPFCEISLAFQTNLNEAKRKYDLKVTRLIVWSVDFPLLSSLFAASSSNPFHWINDCLSPISDHFVGTITFPSFPTFTTYVLSNHALGWPQVHRKKSQNNGHGSSGFMNPFQPPFHWVMLAQAYVCNALLQKKLPLYMERLQKHLKK